MKSNIELKDSSVSGFAEDLRGFLKLLEDMENKKETMRTVSGEFDAQFYSKAEYNYTVKLGIEKNDFPFKRGFLPRQRPSTQVKSIRRKKEVAEPVVDVFEEDGIVSVVAQMSCIKEEDIDLKIIDNILTITARTPEGHIKRDIPISEGSNIKETSFINGILGIKIEKR